MTKDEYKQRMTTIIDVIRADGDGMISMFLNKETDSVLTTFVGVDSLDALAFIEKLVAEFGIDPEVLAEIMPSEKPFEASIPEQGVGFIHLPPIPRKKS